MRSADAFGNALGNSIAGAIETTPGQTQQQTSQQNADQNVAATPTYNGPELGGDIGAPFAPLPTIPSYADASDTSAVPTEAAATIADTNTGGGNTAVVAQNATATAAAINAGDGSVPAAGAAYSNSYAGANVYQGPDGPRLYAVAPSDASGEEGYAGLPVESSSTQTFPGIPQGSGNGAPLSSIPYSIQPLTDADFATPSIDASALAPIPINIDSGSQVIQPQGSAPTGNPAGILDRVGGGLHGLFTIAGGSSEFVVGGAVTLGGLVIPGGVPLGVGLTAFGASNYLGGISELSNAIYGGDRDYNFLKQGFSEASTALGLGPEAGARTYTAVDFALNVPVLLNPESVEFVADLGAPKGPPFALTGSTVLPAIAHEPLLQQGLDVFNVIDQVNSYGKGN